MNGIKNLSKYFLLLRGWQFKPLQWLSIVAFNMLWKKSLLIDFKWPLRGMNLAVLQVVPLKLFFYMFYSWYVLCVIFFLICVEDYVLFTLTGTSYCEINTNCKRSPLFIHPFATVFLIGHKILRQRYIRVGGVLWRHICVTSSRLSHVPALLLFKTVGM